MELQTSRLRLRPWRPDQDAEPAFAVYRDPEVNRYIGGRTVGSVDEMRESLVNWVARTARYPEGMGTWAAVWDGVVIGMGLLKPLPESTDPPPATPLDRVLTNDIEVGWHLGKAWWGQGFATEMGQALIEYGFSGLDLAEIHCVVEPANEASKRVALRCGFNPTGRTNAYYNLELDHFLLGRPT